MKRLGFVHSRRPASGTPRVSFGLAANRTYCFKCDHDAISARELSRGYYSEEQASAALKSVYGVDSMLIEDGTYFVAVAADIIIGCGGWSKRKTLFGGDQFSNRNAALIDPRFEAAKIRAFFVHPNFAR